MELWNWISGMFDNGGCIAEICPPPRMDINPATGLPMIGGIDVVGNPYGTNHDHWHSHDCFHGHSSQGGTFDDW